MKTIFNIAISIALGCSCASCSDFLNLTPYSEITAGALREHRYEVLKRQAEEKGLTNDVEFYLQFFRYGCPPHGGFGLGIDRMTMLFLGLSIKEAEFLFRGPNRLTP